MNEQIAEMVRKEISEHDNNEIFFGCKVDENGMIVSAEPVCYGCQDEVLAPSHAAQSFNAIMHNHPSGVTTPSNADLSTASYYSNQGIGSFIIDNNAENLTVVVPPVVVKKISKMETTNIRDYFSSNGTLSQYKSDFEFRQGQLDMATDVVEAFNENSIAILEAGTGTGKSFAYLIPAFIWAAQNEQRVVISTNTINLQHQIFEKDIPLVKKMLGSPLEAALIKGRKNYLCKMKLLNIQGELMFDDDPELDKVMKWAENTDEGCIDELSFTPSNEVWERVCSDSDFCLGHNCEFFSSCFLQQSRRKASESDILILNHALLFADVQIRSEGEGLEENSLLPPYRKIIFDEAHNIDKAAASFFSTSFSKSVFYKFLQLFRQRGNKGFLHSLVTRFSKSKETDVLKLGERIEEQIIPDFMDLYSNSMELFDNISSYIEYILSTDDIYKTGNRISHQHRIKSEEWESQKFRENVLGGIEEIKLKLNDFADSYMILIDIIDSMSDKVKEKYDTDFKMIKAYSKKIENMQKTITGILNSDCEDSVVWFEIFGDIDNPFWTINVAPIDTARLLKEKIYDVFESVVFTSATLSVGNNFDYFKNLTGLSLVKEKKIISKIYQSPFDYKKQVLFISPSRIPEPNSSRYNDELNEFIRKTVKQTNGSAFVLFTSYKQMNATYDATADFFETLGLETFKQGQMSNAKLMTSFKEDIHSNLYGTDSFWEGVDAPGDTLRYVILTRLPFRMPSDPLEEAKVEALERRGLNAFTDYSLPSAVIRFKQGFGRLIRTKRDFGVVSLLDSRAFTKPYGKLFFRSLPECQFVSGELDTLCNAIDVFFAKKENDKVDE